MDEAVIRADERAKVEADLRAMNSPEGRDEPGHVDENTSRAGAPPDTEREFVPSPDRRHDVDDAVGGPRRHDDDDLLEPIEVVRTRSFSFGQLLTMLVGAALIVLGVFALIETGADTPLDQPVEDVFGYAHTPLLGIFEIGVGALLVLLSLRPGGRWFAAVLGLILVVAGLLVLGELDWVAEELGAESDYAWIPIVAGVAVVAAALMTPRRRQRMTGVPTVAPTA